MELSIPLSYGPQGSDGDPEWVCFTLNTYKATFIWDILMYDQIAEIRASFHTHRWRQDRRMLKWKYFFREKNTA